MLNTKRFVPVLGAILGLFLAGTVSAKAAGKEKVRSYSISVSAPKKIGTQVLKPGDYKVKLEGSNAIFTKANSKETITAPATIVTGDEKFGATTIHQVDDAGQARVTTIELEGTKDLLKFD